MDFKFGQCIQRIHLNKSPLKILEKGNRGRIQVLPKFFGYPLYYLTKGKSYGFQIWPVHSEDPSEKSPLKLLEKRERGRTQGLHKFFGYPLLSQEREKLRISNLASTFRWPIRIKAHEKVWRTESVGVSRDCPFFGYPLFQEREKLLISNLVRIFRGSIRTKSH